MQIDTLILPQWLATATHDHALTNHAVAIDQGRIVAVCTAHEARQFEARETWELPKHLITPGLINSHTHAAMTVLRGIADDLPFDDWLHKHVWPAESQHMSESFVRDGVRLAIAEMLLGGTTCFNDMYFFSDVVAESAQALGMRAVVGLIVVDFPTVWAASEDEYFSRATALHDECHALPLVTTAFAPHAPYSVSDRPFQRARKLADELQVPLHSHIHESASEIKASIEQYGARPLARLDQLGLLGPNLLAVHMTQLEGHEIDRIAELGVNVAHCPESNLKLATGMCPVQRLIDAGINVSLGTDGAASNNDLDMIGEMRTAALLAKGISGNPSAVSAPKALQMATLNGARSLGLAEEIGSIEVGKAADLVAIDFDTPATTPVYEPISQLVYAASRDQVKHVWVAGKQRVRDGQLVDINLAELQAAADRWQRQIKNTDANLGRTD